MEVIIYQFCGYFFCIYILICTCDDTRGTLCNIIIEFVGTCVCIYVTVQQLHFLIIFCASYKSVNKQVCVIASMYVRVHSCVYMCESFMRVYVCVIHVYMWVVYMCVSFMRVYVGVCVCNSCVYTCCSFMRVDVCIDLYI